MAKYNTLNSLFTAIADAVRAKKGSTAQMIADRFPEEISSIPTTGKIPVLQSLSVTENGVFTPPSGVDGYSPVRVNVAGAADIPLKYAVINVSSDVTTKGIYFLTDVDFIKQHYSNPGFFVTMWAESPSKEMGYITFNYCGNMLTGNSASGRDYYGITVFTSAADASFARTQTAKVMGNPEGYNGTLQADSTGRLFLYTGGNQKVKAGKYHILMGVLPIHS